MEIINPSKVERFRDVVAVLCDCIDELSREYEIDCHISLKYVTGNVLRLSFRIEEDVDDLVSLFVLQGENEDLARIKARMFILFDEAYKVFCAERYLYSEVILLKVYPFTSSYYELFLYELECLITSTPFDDYLIEYTMGEVLLDDQDGNGPYLTITISLQNNK